MASDDRTRMERVAAQAVGSMVRPHVKVKVDAVHTPASQPGAGHNGGKRTESAVVSVALQGPDTQPHRTNKLASAKVTAHSWGIDQLVVAARRAAEQILADNPSWRREEAR